MSDSASAQVNAQKRRLIAARAIDESEKRMYVQVLSQGQILFEGPVVVYRQGGRRILRGIT